MKQQSKKKKLTIHELKSKGLGVYNDYTTQPVSDNQKKIYNEHKQFHMEMMFSKDGIESFAVCEDGLVQIKINLLLGVEKRKDFLWKKGRLESDEEGMPFYRIKFNSEEDTWDFYESLSKFRSDGYQFPFDPTNFSLVGTFTLNGEHYIIKAPKNYNGDRYWRSYNPKGKRYCLIYLDIDQKFARRLYTDIELFTMRNK
jgi:hypothetical protein